MPRKMSLLPPSIRRMGKSNVFTSVFPFTGGGGWRCYPSSPVDLGGGTPVLVRGITLVLGVGYSPGQERTGVTPPPRPGQDWGTLWLGGTGLGTHWLGGTGLRYPSPAWDWGTSLHLVTQDFLVACININCTSL